MTTEGYVLVSGRPTGLEEDLVAEVAAVLEWYGCDQGRLTSDCAARAILAARAYRERQAARERGHRAAQDRAARETRTLLDLAEARHRARTALEEVL